MATAKSDQKWLWTAASELGPGERDRGRGGDEAEEEAEAVEGVCLAAAVGERDALLPLAGDDARGEEERADEAEEDARGGREAGRVDGGYGSAHVRPPR
ncbi:MAG: hypothetical protein QM820_65555 [Minicystis sp.]